MSTHPSDTVDRAPRRVALVSDVHGNLPAFRAVVADIEKEGLDETWCLGDLVGYGAQPDECVALAREKCQLCLIGNHDLVVLEKLDLGEFSALAAAAALWTREHIADEAKAWLADLVPEDVSRPIGLFHASPRDPVWEYVLSALLAEDCMDAMSVRVGAIGHSHVALCFWREDGASASGTQAPDGTERELEHGSWLINPGSVGQPRDGDPRAAWLLLDLESWTATWRRVEYPIDEAADAIRDAGLPEALAARLYYGQ
jgi:diadenosine tetraphosphatase ApaH/serine/threonine PP2A family protein phosphatase